MDQLYTISEVAAKLGLATKTLRRWEETGKFVGTRTLGRQRRYTLTDLQILDAIKHGTINSSSDLLTVEQAASLFGVTPTTISRWEDLGKIHPLITATSTYYPRPRLLSQMSELKELTQPTELPIPHFPDLNNPPALPLTSPAQASTPPIFSPSLPPLSPTFVHLPSLFLNLLVTTVLLFVYHLLFNLPSKVSSPTSQVQGVGTSRDPSLLLLDSILDNTGTLKPKSLSTNTLSLYPTIPPPGVPGTLYFDAGLQSLKIYQNNAWVTLGGNTSLVGAATLAKGQNQVSVTNPKLKPDSLLTVTFNSDYSPADKYWVTVGDGSFTLHTNLPVTKDSTFSYFLP